MIHTAPQRSRRNACRHRAWRLARLLTPDRALARELFLRVAEERPNLHRLPPARLDRLLILRAREIVAHPPKRLRPPDTPSDAPDPLAAALPADTLRTAHTLQRQAMEAWMLCHADQLGDIAISRAMDCSRTALTRHLERADQTMRDHFGDRLDEAVESLRQALNQLDPAPAVREWRGRRRRRWVTRLALTAAAAAALLFLATSVWNTGWAQQGIDALLTWLERKTTGG